MSFDLHIHSIFSDGELIPAEIARRYAVKGYKAIAITDHADASNMEFILRHLTRAKQNIQGHGVRVLIGIELTHIPVESIPKLAKKAKELGAEIVVVHGETLVEPVAQGTNLKAAITQEVDILAHPGLITLEEAELARENDVFLEISARRGHCLANGHVVRVAQETGARLVVSTDAHSPGDIITPEEMFRVALGSGLTEKDSKIATLVNPKSIIGD